MALVGVGPVCYPDLMNMQLFTGANAISKVAATSGLASDADKVSFIFQIPTIPAAETIHTLGVLIGTVTAAADLTVGLYTIDASGNPTNTAYGGMAAGTISSAAVVADTWVEANLATDCTPVAAGDLVALTLTGATGVNITLSYISTACCPPGLMRYTAAAWSYKVARPIAGIKWSGGTWGQTGMFPVKAGSYLTFASNTAINDEYALIFTAPFAARAIGIAAILRTAAGGDFSAVLYEGTTLRASVALDGDVYISTFVLRNLLFSAPYTLVKGTTYYVAIKPTTTTAVLLPYYDVNSNALLGAIPNGTETMYETWRVDAGAWNAGTNTRRPAIALLLDQIDDGDYSTYTLISSVVAATDVRNGTARYSGGSNGTAYIPAAADVEFGVNVDATTGTFVVPAVGDVQSGVTFGNATEFTGTFTSPAVGKVISDTSWGAGGTEFTGTYHATLVAEVLDTVSFGAASAETGTYNEATVAEVQDGVFFGPASAYEGTYVGGGGGGGSLIGPSVLVS